MRFTFKTMICVAVLGAFGCGGGDDTGGTRVKLCERNGDCVRSGVEGECRTEGYCAFDDDTCPSGMRWDSTAAEEYANICVAGEADAGSLNACGGTNELSAEPGTPCGACDLGSYECDGTNAVVCAGEPVDSMEIAGEEGAVEASQEFNETFVAAMTVDGMYETSWFSKGPEEEGPTTYTWTGERDDCIESIRLRGNAMATTERFRQGFSFANITVKVYNDADEVVFSEDFHPALAPNTPFELADVETVGVVGRKVVVEMSGHESTLCGGFSELEVDVLR